MDGEEIATPEGKFFLVGRSDSVGAFHGRKRIGDFSKIDMSHAALLAGHTALARLDYRDALFLDTETTGLAGGTGTLAFLVGVGWYEGGFFVTRQLFARDHSEEPAILSHLAELAKERRFLVTFNGKAFDVGLLTARYILNRLEDPFPRMPHLDLLHPSRRLLGHRLDNSRLVTIEGAVLGFWREGDVPGYEIPQRYFDWLHSRNPGLITGIIEHNRLDILSMAALALHLCELLGYGPDAEGVEHSDVMAASRLCMDRGESDLACRMYHKLAFSGESPFRQEARRNLSLAWKREGKWDQASVLWKEMATDRPLDTFPLTELAKWYEHRVGDLVSARELVKRALGLDGLVPDEKDRLEYRLSRIERRVALDTRKLNRAKRD